MDSPSFIAHDQDSRTSSSCPMRTRHLMPVRLIGSASKILFSSIWILLDSLIPRHHAWSLIALSCLRLTSRRSSRSRRAFRSTFCSAAAVDAPPRLICLLFSSPKTGIIETGKICRAYCDCFDVTCDIFECSI